MAGNIFQSLRARYGRPTDTGPGPSRRDFLRSSAALTAGLLLSPSIVFSKPQPQKHIAVIGAGFAGLSCAYELTRAGYRVTVLEARDRIAGRVMSYHDLVDGATVEGGGEFIGLNHPHWLHYAKIFDLPLRESSDFSDLHQPMVIDGQRLSKSESRRLFEESDALLKRLNALAEKIDADEPWKSPLAERLDRTSLGDWLRRQKVDALTLKVARIQIGSDNGVDVDQQSLLGNLAMIKGGGVDKYWDESEWFRCENGNNLLARELAEEIGAENILLRTPVVAIRTGNGKCEIDCLHRSTMLFDEIVLAIPHSTWKHIQFEPALPGILTPQMGKAVKYISHVGSRFWLDRKMSPEGLTNGLISQTWEPTDAQETRDGYAITAFIGGPQAEQSMTIDPRHHHGLHEQELDLLLPGAANQIKVARYMNWPNEPYSNGAYSFPAPGEITRIGPTLREGLPNLHFAGEYCSYGFIGYMEGALESGMRVAKQIAARDGVI